MQRSPPGVNRDRPRSNRVKSSLHGLWLMLARGLAGAYRPIASRAMAGPQTERAGGARWTHAQPQAPVAASSESVLEHEASKALKASRRLRRWAVETGECRSRTRDDPRTAR